jgi:hypothetical protein
MIHDGVQDAPQMDTNWRERNLFALIVKYIEISTSEYFVLNKALE